MQKPPDRLRFGEFELDAVSFRVLRDGAEVPLEPKAVDLLLYLIHRPGQLVSKEQLFGSLWTGTAVTDNALTRVVAQLRRALGDEARNPRFIETVPTRGYRFIGEWLPDSGLPSPSTGCDPLPSVSHQQPSIGRWYLTAAVLVTAGLLVLATSSPGILRRSSAASESDPAIVRSTAQRVPSVAVLSFKNLTGDVEQEYFAEGLSQALRDTFAESGMSVAAATSTRRAQSSLTIRQIAHELNVDAVLEGAVVRSGDRIRVSAALIDGSSERRLWTQVYERQLADVLNLYSDIALTVASEMNVAVAKSTKPQIERRNRIVPEAYDNYLRGAYFAGNRWMAGGCRQAESYLLRAIALDPQFAASYATLAWCYAYPDRIGRGIDEVGPKAKAAVARALALDSHLALAHVVQGTIEWRIDYQPALAEIEFKKALALDAGLGLAYVPYAELLIWQRQSSEMGVRLLRRSVEIDPFSPERRVQAGFVLLVVGMYDDAIQELLKALELDPSYLTARLWLAEAYGYKGTYDAAVQQYLKWLDGVLVSSEAAEARTTLTRAYERRGWLGFWRREAQLAETDATHRGSVWQTPYDRYTGPWFMARRYARLGDTVRALDYLEDAYRTRHHLVATMSMDPVFKRIRNEPRFVELMRLTAGAS